MQNQPQSAHDYHIIPVKEKFDRILNVNMSRYSPPDTISFLHYHQEVEIGLCLCGSGVFIIGDRSYRFSRGDITCIPPGVVHFAQSDENNPSSWYFITIPTEKVESPLLQKALERCHNLSPGSSIIHGVYYPYVQTTIETLYQEYAERQGNFDIMIESLLPALLILLDRISGSETEENDVSTKRLNELLPAMKYITTCYSEPVVIKKLCDLCHCSETQLRRLFREVLNTSPNRYWHTIRINHAEEILTEGSKTITQIAFEVGYDSISSFNRHFRDERNQSPRDVKGKKKHQNP